MHMTFRDVFLALWSLPFWIYGLAAAFCACAVLVFTTSNQVSHSDHEGPAVFESALNTTVAAQQLQNAYFDKLREFDKVSQQCFGLRHQWNDPNRDEPTPSNVRLWIRSHDPSTWTALNREYGHLAVEYHYFQQKWKQHDAELKRIVKLNSQSLKNDELFNAQHLVRNEIPIAIEDLSLRTERLRRLGQGDFSIKENTDEVFAHH